MPNATEVRFSITNLAYSITNILKGISFVQGITKRGPVMNPETIVTSWTQFVRIFGGYTSDSDFPVLMERAFARGAQLRVSSVRHFTDPSDRNTLTATKATMSSAQILTFDAALIVGNLFDFDIDGVAINQVPFNTDSNTTMADILAELLLLDVVENAYIIDAGAGTDDDRQIVIFWAEAPDSPVINAAVSGGASQAGVTLDDNLGILDSAGNLLFEPTLKYEGEDYDNVYLQITDADNGQAGYFNMYIRHALEPSLNEKYANLKIPLVPPSAINSTYLDTAKQASQLMDFTYYDLSALSGQLRPINGTYFFGGGFNGGAVVDTDYIGNSAGKTGFYAFDDYNDAFQIAAPEMSDNTIHVAGAAYAEMRKDLQYLAHLSNSLTTQTALVAARAATNIDSYYTSFSGGGLKITDPVSGAVKEISEIGDLLGIAAYVDSTIGQWASQAGRTKSKIFNALGVVNNFGSPAKFADLNILSNRQINMVIQRDNIIFVEGNLSAALATSPLSYNSAVRLLMFIQKSIRPTLERYIEEPCDIPTWKALYREVEPFFLDLIKERAIFSYRWKGDQDISKIEDVVVNQLADVQNGLYKVKLFLKITPYMREIEVELVVTPLGVSFDLL